MLQQPWLRFLPRPSSPFPVSAHVRSPPFSLYGAAGSQPWSKFKPHGSERASSCQKNPNLWVLGLLWERVLGQSNQRLTLLLNTNQTARLEDFPSGAWLSFSSIQTPFTRSQLQEPHLSSVRFLPSRHGTKLCELGGQMQTSVLSLRLPQPTRPGWTQQGSLDHRGTHQWLVFHL